MRKNLPSNLCFGSRSLPVLLAGLLIGSLAWGEQDQAGTGATAEDFEATAEESADGLPDPDAWEAGPDRETLVRFARAWGQVTSVLDQHDSDKDPLDTGLREPRELPRELSREVRRHIRNNGLSEDTWKDLLERMDQDEDFLARVEMLAVPYQTPSETPDQTEDLPAIP